MQEAEWLGFLIGGLEQILYIQCFKFKDYHLNLTCSAENDTNIWSIQRAAPSVIKMVIATKPVLPSYATPRSCIKCDRMTRGLSSHEEAVVERSPSDALMIALA